MPRKADDHMSGLRVFSRVMWMGVTGYSFSGVDNTFHGLFSSVEDAMKDLSRRGVIVSE